MTRHSVQGVLLVLVLVGLLACGAVDSEEEVAAPDAVPADHQDGR